MVGYVCKGQFSVILDVRWRKGTETAATRVLIMHYKWQNWQREVSALDVMNEMCLSGLLMSRSWIYCACVHLKNLRPAIKFQADNVANEGETGSMFDILDSGHCATLSQQRCVDEKGSTESLNNNSNPHVLEC